MFFNFSDVIRELCFGQADVHDGFLCFHHRQHLPIFAVERVIRHPVPRLGIVSIHRDFDLYLGMVSKIPTRPFQLRIDKFLAGAFFGEFTGHDSFSRYNIAIFPTSRLNKGYSQIPLHARCLLLQNPAKMPTRQNPSPY